MRLLLLSRSVARLSRCSSTLQPNSPVSRCLCSASQPLSGEMLHSRRHLHHLSRSHMRLFSKKTKDMWWFTEGVSDNCPTVDVHPATILEGSSHRDGSIYKFCPGFIQIYGYIAVRDHLDSMLNYVVNRSRDGIIVKQVIADYHMRGRPRPGQLHLPLPPLYLVRYHCLEPSSASSSWALRHHSPLMLVTSALAPVPLPYACLGHFCPSPILSPPLPLVYIPLGLVSTPSRVMMLKTGVAFPDRSPPYPDLVANGSCIEMVGPKRGISMSCSVVLEFDMRIKKGDREEDDLELIDGALEYSQITTPAMRPMNSRVSGNCGAVDITLAYLYQAVEATIEVSISKVRQEIQLFDGMVGEPCGLRRYVVAVASDTWMHLKFKVCEKGSKNDVGRYCSFKANRHGFASQQIVVEPGAITVKTVGDIL
uniref:DUF6598 domain-containing protein n=1 Tax=Oryza glumipatula TaxID=40148 RepID=A0A0E0B0F3_9ORYZ